MIYLLSWAGSGAHHTARRRWTFDAAGVTSVMIASIRANEARVIEGRSSRVVEISAQPRRIPNGYHAREPEGHEVSAADWPFHWKVERNGGELRLQCDGETRLKHCHYLLEEVEIRAPVGAQVRCEGALPTARR